MRRLTILADSAGVLAATSLVMPKVSALHARATLVQAAATPLAGGAIVETTARRTLRHTRSIRDAERNAGKALLKGAFCGRRRTARAMCTTFSPQDSERVGSGRSPKQHIKNRWQRVSIPFHC